MGKGAFIQEVKRACMQALAEIGLHRRELGIAITPPSAAGISGWIGLGTSTRYSSTEMEVFPTLGVHWEALNELDSEIRGQKCHRNSATIVAPLHTRMPGKKRREFIFRVQDPPERGARRLARAVKQYGFPYFRKHTTVKSLIAALEREDLWSAEEILCAHYLADRDCDLKALARRLRARARTCDVDVDDLDGFLQRLLARQRGQAPRAAPRTPPKPTAEERRIAAALAKQRRAFEQELARALRDVARGAGWKHSQGSVFREVESFFFAAQMDAWDDGDGERTVWELEAKPMAVDPVFWTIMDMEDARDQPLSFRRWGAFVCTAVPIAERPHKPATEGAAETARAFLRWVEREVGRFLREWRERPFSELVKGHEHYRARGAYANTLVSALIAEGRLARAAALTEQFRSGKRSTTLEQHVGKYSFFDLTARWLERNRRPERRARGRSRESRT